MAVALHPFNSAIDRHDQRSAVKLFQLLWPDPAVSHAVAVNLAASIRAAHAAAEASWAVTMFPQMLRLNVGQVETLTLSETNARFLFSAPLEVSLQPRFHLELPNRPVYRSVPVPSGVCSFPIAELKSLPRPIRDAHEAYIEAAASLKRTSPFKKSFSPAVVEYIESVLATKLPRPGYLMTGLVDSRIDPLAEEVQEDQTLFEGARYQVTINAYERDPIARQLCIARHGTACMICGFSFGLAYGPVAENFIHVHHLRPLSEIGGEYEVNPIEDLRPVCPNCHAVIHRRTPAFSIDEVRCYCESGRSRYDRLPKIYRA